MSGFDLAELLPFYLDETDEHISALNDALLRLEQDVTDVKALQEAFRMFHSIKGASIVMGFRPVNQLTHHLESLFDQLRSKKRELDRPTLDLTFRCLDELRDYHRDLRAQKPGATDLAKLVVEVVAYLQATVPDSNRVSSAPPVSRPATIAPSDPQSEQEPLATPAVPPTVSAMAAPVKPPTMTRAFDEAGGIALTVIFQVKLPLADMKARLVLNRLSTKVRVLSTDPPVERLDEVDPLARFTVFLTTECELDELRALADVEGVTEIRIEAIAAQMSPAPYLTSQPQTAARPGDSREISPALSSTMPPLNRAVTPIAEITPGISPSQPMTEVTNRLVDLTTSKQPANPGKAKVAETIRVESDRLDHLMNLAGELVITKARFVAIARGMDELFRGSNARALTSDTRERLESITRGLNGLAEFKGGSSAGSLDRWSVHFRRLRDNFLAIQDELNVIRRGT